MCWVIKNWQSESGGGQVAEHLKQRLGTTGGASDRQDTDGRKLVGQSRNVVGPFDRSRATLYDGPPRCCRRGSGHAPLAFDRKWPARCRLHTGIAGRSTERFDLSTPVPA